MSLTNIGNLDRLEGRLSEAEPLERRALAIREAAFGPDHPEVADSLDDLGALYAAQRRFSDAEPLLRRAVAIQVKAWGTDDPLVATKSLGALSDMYVAAGRLDTALDTSAEAVATLERYLEHSARLRSSGQQAERRGYRDAFLKYIALTQAGGAPGARDAGVDRSFQAAQFALASTTAQAVAGMAARFAAGTDGLAVAVRRLQDATARWERLDRAIIRDTGAAPADRPPADETALRQAYDGASRQLDALEADIAREFPAYATLTSADPLSVAAAQALLGPDEVLLVFLVGDDASWLWSVRDRQAQVFRLDITAPELTEAVKALRANLDPWQNETLRPYPARRANELYRRLLGPAAATLRPSDRLIVVPDGALQGLPLGVLVTRPPARDPVDLSDHRAVAWLAREHAITVIPSVGSLRALRVFVARSHASLPFAGVGNPVLGVAPPRDAPRGGVLGRGLAEPIDAQEHDLFRFAPVNVRGLRELPPLPDTADELRAIARTVGAADDSLFLASRASEPVVRQAHLERYRIVEFATHGLMSGDLGLGEPALVLTPPDEATVDDKGLLTASKVATLRLDADWVVLSACNTAAGDGTPDAGGLSGLARAFFYAGARSVLVSHWSVVSAATVRLTTGAFAELARDPTIGRAEALRRAQLAMMDASNPPELSHPMAWAPFVLAGEGGAGR